MGSGRYGPSGRARASGRGHKGRNWQTHHGLKLVELVAFNTVGWVQRELLAGGGARHLARPTSLVQ